LAHLFNLWHKWLYKSSIVDNNSSMITSLLLVKIFVGAASLGGGYFLLKRVTKTENKKQLKLERLQERIDDRVEEDLTDIKRDLLVLKVKKHSIDDEFSELLTQVHEIFEKRDYQHPRAHTFYNLLLPKVLKVKEARKALSGMSDKDFDTEEMYASLKAWMEDIVAHKIDGLEGEAEINAKVITLLTK